MNWALLFVSAKEKFIIIKIENELYNMKGKNGMERALKSIQDSLLLAKSQPNLGLLIFITNKKKRQNTQKIRT